MGGIFTRLLQTFSFKKKVCVLITGEFGSGKTTIMYQWLLGKCITPVHTVGSHLETLELEDVTFEFFDIGGETKVQRAASYRPSSSAFLQSRPIIQHVVSRNLSNYKKRGIVFVIDSCDREWFVLCASCLADFDVWPGWAIRENCSGNYWNLTLLAVWCEILLQITCD
eukprot:132762-Hanusia_phi.AAC.1